MGNTTSNFSSITPQRISVFLIPGISLIFFGCQFYRDLRIVQNLSTYATNLPPHHRLITNKSWHHGTKEVKERNYSYCSQSPTYENSQWSDLQSGNATDLCALEYVPARRRPCRWSSSARLI